MDFKNIAEYTKYPPSNRCYLDGGYFGKVFSRYPGWIDDPIIIELDKSTSLLPLIRRRCKFPSLLRVIVTQNAIRHDTILILDHSIRTGYWFNCFDSEHDSEIETILENILKYDIFRVEERGKNIDNKLCDMSGFCTAYSIKYGYDFLRGEPYSGNDVLSFASWVESTYGKINQHPDICHGWLDDPKTRNTIIGALGGSAVGGLLGGSGGLLAGAAIGGIGGNLITR